MVSRGYAWLVALVAGLTMTVSYIDRSTLAVLAPSVTKALDISDTQYGWLTSAFSLAYLVAVPAAGWWIDRAGARRGLVVSVLAWSAVAALHALVPGFGVLFVLRIALGVAEAPGFPGATQTMVRMLSAPDRSRGFGLLFTGSSLGAMIAPPLASALYDVAGWRAAFLVSAAAGLVWIPVWLALTGAPEVRARLDARPAPAAGSPATFWSLLREPTMQRALAAVFAVAPVNGFVMTWGSKLLVNRFGIPQGSVGHYLWLPALGLDLGALGFGDLAARQRRAPGAPPRALFAIAACCAAAIALAPQVAAPWALTAVGALALLGGGAMYTLVTSDLLAHAPADRVAFAGGILTGAQSLAVIISSPLIGLAVDRLGNYELAAALLGAWVAPGAVVWLVWRPRAMGAAGAAA